MGKRRAREFTSKHKIRLSLAVVACLSLDLCIESDAISHAWRATVIFWVETLTRSGFDPITLEIDLCVYRFSFH